MRVPFPHLLAVAFCVLCVGGCQSTELPPDDATPTVGVSILERVVREPSLRQEERYQELVKLHLRQVMPDPSAWPHKPEPTAQLTLALAYDAPRRVRAFSGTFVFSDLFDSEKFRWPCRTDPPSDGSREWKLRVDIESTWLSRTDLSEVRVRFDIDAVAYRDGGVEKRR